MSSKFHPGKITVLCLCKLSDVNAYPTPLINRFRWGNIQRWFGKTLRKIILHLISKFTFNFVPWSFAALSLVFRNTHKLRENYETNTNCATIRWKYWRNYIVNKLDEGITQTPVKNIIFQLFINGFLKIIVLSEWFE